MNEPVQSLKTHITRSLVTLVVLMTLVGTVFCGTALAQAPDDGHAPDVAGTNTTDGHGLYGLLAAAAAFGLGAIGAGIAISHVGAAAMGAVAEKPQIAGQALIFVALAEGIVVFGFITALMILGKV